MVSVIIPCYNAQETICTCVNSVLQQTYKDYEIVVIDDGSKDQSVSVLKDYLKHLRYNKDNISIISQKNMGPSAARNNGIRVAKGTHIAFLDADDQWQPEKLEIQLSIMEKHPHIRLASCGYNNQSQKSIEGFAVISFKELLKKNYFAATSTVIVHKEALKNLSFNEQQKHSEDYRLWLQIARNNSCALIQKPLASSISQKLEYGEAGLSADLWKMEKGELSNYRFIYKEGYISFPAFIAISCFSLLKHIRRTVIVTLKRY